MNAAEVIIRINRSNIVRYDRNTGKLFSDNLSAPGFRTKYIPRAIKNGFRTLSR
tara:strand:+ start:183 stop:344 length:162 start_codon:yes stop_codon:yes gene_type:complete